MHYLKHQAYARLWLDHSAILAPGTNSGGKDHPLSSLPSCPSFQLLAEVLDGIKVYFDFTLADHLLYGREKEQHRQLGILNPVFSKKPSSHHQGSVSADSGGTERQLQGHLPSQVYGATHLLRLFVRLPHFLQAAQIPSNHLHLLHNHFKDLFG